MKHMNKLTKKVCVFALAAMIPIALAACGGGELPSDGSNQNQNSDVGSVDSSDTHVYMKDWYYDENTHWRMCAEFTCLMAELRFEEAAHQFTYGEPDVIHSLGETDLISVEKTCGVCAATFTDHSRGDKIYGSFEYPAEPSDLPETFLIQPEKRGNISVLRSATDFNEEETWYCSIEVERAGQMTLLESFYFGASEPDLNNPLSGREGEFHLYDPDKQEKKVTLTNSSVHVGNSYFTFNDYTVHVEPGTYILSIKHNYYRKGYSSRNYYSMAYQLS